MFSNNKYSRSIALLCLVLLSCSSMAQGPGGRGFGGLMGGGDPVDDFVGITSNGEPEEGLFSVYATGIDTGDLLQTTRRFIESLSTEQRESTLFPADDIEWRKWANMHVYVRDGISFEEMNASQREAAFAMLQASLSAKGLKLTRDIMKLNETLGELNNNNFDEYGEWKYHITIMGTPSATEPWGWQLDGHHLILNYFVLGDQVVMTPAFWGSEPVIAESGKYAGTAILQEEQEQGRLMMLALNDKQQAEATLMEAKTRNNIMTEAFSDNVVLESAGSSVASFNTAQKAQLLRLIGLYVGNIRGEHAVVNMAEVAAHLDETKFAWIGGTEKDDVYYYRIQSPVILIEFDHETPVGLRHLYARGVPYREHIHAVVRTPNGNDYGKDLLRQHYEDHPH